MDDSVRSESNKFRCQWLAPIALSGFTIVGLISALIADGIWDAFSWVALSLPALTALYIAIIASD